jgi:hypothetical protein
LLSGKADATEICSFIVQEGDGLEFHRIPDRAQVKLETFDRRFAGNMINAYTNLGVLSGAVNFNRATVGINQLGELRTVFDPLAHLGAQNGKTVCLRS